MMYERFYGLRERPFDLVPNPRFLFVSARQREALSNLRFGLTASRGVTLLLGEAGTGKTTLIQATLAELDRGAVECVLVSNPTLTRGEFYEYLAAGFGLSNVAAASKTQFLFELRSHLMQRHEAGLSSALMLDEAQSLPYELVEEVRLLSNIETPSAKLLNVVLVGQPELAARLNEPGLRQLKQRIALRCELALFDFHEAAGYIAGRLRIAGGDPGQIFTREAVKSIYDASGGVPRTLNVVCDNALISGFAAQERPVTRAIVEEVCRDFDLQQRLIASQPAAPAAEIPVPAAPPAPAPAAAPRAPEPVAEETAAHVDAEPPGQLFGTHGRRRRFSFF